MSESQANIRENSERPIESESPVTSRSPAKRSRPPRTAPPRPCTLYDTVEFKPLFRTKFRPGTWKRYEGILSQGLLDELGDKHVDEITAPTVRAFMAFLGKRGVQSRGPVNLLRTLLTAVVETAELEAMPDLPKAPPPGRKLPSAPSTDEVNALRANATDG